VPVAFEFLEISESFNESAAVQAHTSNALGCQVTCLITAARSI
jgi:hypothetical protein